MTYNELMVDVYDVQFGEMNLIMVVVHDWSILEGTIEK